ncbi:hypothetical protein DID77_01660 [Candidatus Marinamargulisbacteria bacterium SCGC AG-439-L15]|nr:hypothetical protein DID77_01660 [Candidatus Marinamargulisbacteria bacterium SCGC AG-439-L15]
MAKINAKENTFQNTRLRRKPQRLIETCDGPKIGKATKTKRPNSTKPKTPSRVQKRPVVPQQIDSPEISLMRQNSSVSNTDLSSLENYINSDITFVSAQDLLDISPSKMLSDLTNTWPSVGETVSPLKLPSPSRLISDREMTEIMRSDIFRGGLFS